MASEHSNIPTQVLTLKWHAGSIKPWPCLEGLWGHLEAKFLPLTKVTYCQCTVPDIWSNESLNCAIFCISRIESLHVVLLYSPDDEHSYHRENYQHYHGSQYNDDQRFHAVTCSFPLQGLPLEKRKNKRKNVRMPGENTSTTRPAVCSVATHTGRGFYTVKAAAHLHKVCCHDSAAQNSFSIS